MRCESKRKIRIPTNASIPYEQCRLKTKELLDNRWLPSVEDVELPVINSYSHVAA